MNDNDKLKSLLNEWSINPQLSGDYRGEVWRKISEREDRPPSILSSVRNLFSTAREIYLTCIIALLCGAMYGLWSGEKAHHQIFANLENRYIQSINPLAVNHLNEVHLNDL